MANQTIDSGAGSLPPAVSRYGAPPYVSYVPYLPNAVRRPGRASVCHALASQAGSWQKS